MATTTMMTSAGSSNTSSSHAETAETSDNSDLITTHNNNNNTASIATATVTTTTAKSAAHQAFASTSSANASQRNEQYTLADVYDDAAVIGSELEKIIANYGSDVLKDLMPKVINVLELLEHLTIKNEKENDELNELRSKINSLEMEKAQRINEREKFEKVSTAGRSTLDAQTEIGQDSNIWLLFSGTGRDRGKVETRDHEADRHGQQAQRRQQTLERIARSDQFDPQAKRPAQ